MIEQNNIWSEQLALLNSLYALGITILSDSSSKLPTDSPISIERFFNKWAEYEEHFKKHQHFIDRDTPLKNELTEKAQQIKQIFPKIIDHYQILRDKMSHALLILKGTKSLATTQRKKQDTKFHVSV